MTFDAQMNLDTNDFQGSGHRRNLERRRLGLIVDDDSKNVFLNNLLTAVNSSDLGPTATGILSGVINSYIGQDFSAFIDPITAAMTDQATLADTARIMAQRLCRAASGRGIRATSSEPLGDAASFVQISPSTPPCPTPFGPGTHGTTEGHDDRHQPLHETPSRRGALYAGRQRGHHQRPQAGDHSTPPPT